MGTAEVETALVAHPKVAEAAVVGYPHDIKGQGIYAYVTLKPGSSRRGAAQGAETGCANEIGPIAKPDLICSWPRPAQDALAARSCAASCARSPRTTSRNLGDISTLADPSVVDALVEGRLNR